MRGRLLAVAAAFSMFTAGSAAVAQSAAAPTAPSVRASADVTDANEMRGSWAIIGIVIAAGLIAILLLAGDDDDGPTSP